MTLTELKYIVALAQEKRFSRAAHLCNVSQPSLSMAIKKLEEELELKLFERTAGQVSVTPVGEEIVYEARRILEHAAAIQKIAQRGKDPLAGTIKIGVSYTVGPYLLPELVHHSKARTPQMELILKGSFTERLIEMLGTGEIDCAIMAEPFRSTGLAKAALYDEPLIAAVPASHILARRESVSTTELQGETLLLLEADESLREHLEALSPEAAPALGDAEGVSHTFEGYSLETIKHMVSRGMGITLVPRLSVPQDQMHSGYKRRKDDEHPAEKRRRNDDNQIRYLPIQQESGQPPPVRRIVLAWRRSFPRYEVIAALRNAIYACELPGVTPILR
ncbi:LysR family transcriptional regulator [Acidovorax sp. SUPP950]|uniref:hydrogen peroxide-inducible genes activator n=1 Tax=Acidovorax sp. SUPP950 TaxID=511901 RepID=UPI0023BFF5A0|nr:hydrogen peroxide-inducible genes activator [Acidovorax sp. SUPP950]GKS74162.1 LysR family transcriptional regulator [Acidovorax sp. SUPP950]